MYRKPFSRAAQGIRLYAGAANEASTQSLKRMRRSAATWRARRQVISVHKLTVPRTQEKHCKVGFHVGWTRCGLSVARSPSMSQAMVPLASSPPIESLAVQDTYANGAPLILVAEDNRISRLLLTEQLRLLGLQAEAVETGREALARWRGGRVSVMLTDLQMPEMDGYELAQAIRHDEGEGAHTPIIALSASGLEERTNRWKAAGIDDYLVKPVEMATLKAMLRRWLDPAGAALPSTYPEERQLSAEPLDLQVLAEMVGDETKTVVMFLEDFARSASEDAMAMEVALRSGNPDKARFVAHQFKASARSVGSTRLGSLCAAVEDAVMHTDDSATALAWSRFEAELQIVQHWIRKFSAEHQENSSETAR